MRRQIAASEKMIGLLKRAAELKARIDDEQANHDRRLERQLARLRFLISAAILADVQDNLELKTCVVAVLQRRVSADRDVEFLKEQGWYEQNTRNAGSS